MNLAVYLPLLACVAISQLAPTLSRRLPPATGLWTMTAAALAGAAATLWSLILLGLVLVDDLPAFRRVESLVPVPDIVSGAAVAALAVAVVRLGVVVTRMRRDLVALRGLATEPDLVVAETAAADAFAIPARGLRRGGTVYVTTGMLRALSPVQQRALLAHERTHLLARHHYARSIAALAAAGNPALIPVREAVGYLCERHADEAAATATGSRGVVADAIAAAALTRAAPGAQMRLGLHRVAVADRVRALLAPRPDRVRWHLAALAAAVVVCAVGVLDATRDVAVVAAALGLG